MYDCAIVSRSFVILMCLKVVVGSDPLQFDSNQTATEKQYELHIQFLHRYDELPSMTSHLVKSTTTTARYMSCSCRDAFLAGATKTFLPQYNTAPCLNENRVQATTARPPSAQKKANLAVPGLDANRVPTSCHACLMNLSCCTSTLQLTSMKTACQLHVMLV